MTTKRTGLTLATLLALAGAGAALTRCNGCEPLKEYRDNGMLQTRSGARAHWGSGPIALYVGEDAGGWEIPIREAAAYMNGEIGQPVFVFAEPYAAVVEVRTFDPNAGCPIENCAAFTNVSANIATGLIGNVTVYLPDRDDIRTHPMAFALVAHELGHVLGLDDDGDHADGLMSRTMALDGEFPDLSGQDRDLLRKYYGGAR